MQSRQWQIKYRYITLVAGSRVIVQRKPAFLLESGTFSRSLSALKGLMLIDQNIK